MRHAPLAPEYHPDPAREPVVAVYQVVFDVLGCLEGAQIAKKLWDVLVVGVLGRRVRAGLQVDDAGSISELYDRRVCRVVAPRIYVDEMAASAKLSRELKNVNVHAAGVFLAQAGDRTTVKT